MAASSTSNDAMLQGQMQYQLPASQLGDEVEKKEELSSNTQTNKTAAASCKESGSNAEPLVANEALTKPHDQLHREASISKCSNQLYKEHACKLAEAGFYITDSDLVQCFSCCIGLGNWCTNENIWERHARLSPECRHVQTEGGKYFEAQFLDLKTKKKQVYGENLEHFRMKEWLVCKLCSLSTSSILLLPCHHFCLCLECDNIAKECPSCGQFILKKVHATLVQYSN